MLEILRAEGADATRWHTLIAELPAGLRDIHFLPQYGRIYEDAYAYEPLLASWRCDEGFILQPLVRRPLGELPFLRAHADRALFTDLANPYGFGGPVASTNSIGATVFRQYAEAILRWCAGEHIASEFASLHPFFQTGQRQLIGGLEAPQYEKDVVYIDLTRSETDLIAGLRKGHRSSVSRAKRSGVIVKAVDPSDAHLAIFETMYDETMRRRQAAARWFLPPGFFRTTVHRLGPDRVSLMLATVSGEPESCCLLIHDFSTAYYHFAATFARHEALGINNLMVFEAALLMKAQGFEKLHLGGGVSSSPDDSLFRFKAGFSSDRAPLYTYFAVRSQEAYDELCVRKQAYERATDGGESTSDFLPLYRR